MLAVFAVLLGLALAHSSSSSSSSSSPSSVDDNLVVVELNIRSAFKNPDNFDPDTSDRGVGQRAIIEINGQMPGPVIRLKLGQTLVATVVNHIHAHAVTVHWHGVSVEEEDAVLYDGADRITQSAIVGGGKFTYRFTPAHAGTFFYHLHNVGLIDGGYGALIVTGPEDPVVDGEIIALVSEWGVAVSTDLEAANAAGALGDGAVLSALENSRSVLVNGKVRDVAPVESGKKYILRVINAGFLSNFGIALAGDHPLTVFQADGHYVEQQTVSGVFFGAFAAGQRYSFVLAANEDAGSGEYEIRFTSFIQTIGAGVGGAVGPKHGSLFLQYGGGDSDDLGVPNPAPLPAPGPGVLSDENDLRGDTSKEQYGEVPQGAADVVVVFDSNLNFQTGAWHLAGNTPFDLAPGVPFIAGNRKGAVYFDVPLNAVVDIVTIGTLLPHPFHGHIESAYQVARGIGAFPGYTQELIETFNLENPVRRDTYQTPVDQNPANPTVGWSVSRLVATKVGPHLYHCHILAHHHHGMSAILNVGDASELHVPHGFPLSGDFTPSDSLRDQSSSLFSSESSSDSSSSSSSSASASKKKVTVLLPKFE